MAMTCLQSVYPNDVKMLVLCYSNPICLVGLYEITFNIPVMMLPMMKLKQRLNWHTFMMKCVIDLKAITPR